jgi:hypothetical protein
LLEQLATGSDVQDQLEAIVTLLLLAHGLVATAWSALFAT